MITKKEIVELLNDYSGYVDRSCTDKAIHEDNFELIADAILSKLHQPAVSRQSELLFDFAEWISLNNWVCKGYAQNHWDQNGKGNWKTTRDLFELYKNSH